MSSSVHVVCGACGAINRIPRQRLTQQPTCGRCHRAVFTGSVLTLGEQNFSRYLEKDELPLLVDFWAPWCGPCKAMAPEFAAAVADLEPNMRLAKVDTEAQGGLAARYQIRSIPTLILFHQGREISRHSGAMNRRQLVDWARAQLA